MRCRPAWTAAATAAVLAGAACTAAPRAGAVTHVVLVWLKQPGDESTKARLAATAHAFPERIPGLLAVEVGDPLPSDDPRHDESFDLVFVMRFRDAAALAGYEGHPVHQAAVRELLAPAAARVVVHDATLR